MSDAIDPTTTAEARGELFGVHIPELQLPDEEYRSGLRAAALEPGETYVELGSGHGRGLRIAAAEFGAEAIGVEYLDDANARALETARRAGVADHVHVVRDDLRRYDPAHADVVHMHLGPAFHDVLAPRLERLLTAASRVVAAGWRVPGWLPLDTALDTWDGGYVYRPADPRMHATWGATHEVDGDELVHELNVHADLAALEVRVDGSAGGARLSATRAGRGQSLLVAVPREYDGALELWARCRAGRFTLRGQPNRPAT
jgi:hypothetical protein